MKPCIQIDKWLIARPKVTKILRNAVIDADKNGKESVFGYWVSDYERYGIAEFDNQGNCLSIEENP